MVRTKEPGFCSSSYSHFSVAFKKFASWFNHTHLLSASGRVYFYRLIYIVESCVSIVQFAMFVLVKLELELTLFYQYLKPLYP